MSNIYNAISYELGYDRKEYFRKLKSKKIKRPKKPQGGRNLKESRFNGKNQMIGEEKNSLQ